MILQHLTLCHFRNYEFLDLDFSPKLNLITGDNGSGKTNLAEAIYYLSLAKSWRTDEASALISEGTDAAFIAADILRAGVSRHVEITLTRKGKKVSINGSPIRRRSELSNLVNAILFTPEDVNLFKGPPSDRRGFLDTAIAKRDEQYLRLIIDHAKLLEERNALLKAENPDRTHLAVLTKRLIEVGAPIESARRRYVADLNKVLSGLAARLYGRERAVFVDFHPFVKNGDYPAEAQKIYERALESDLLRKTTGVGLQREDFSLLLDEKDISLYGSQGENRLAAIALKLAPFFLIEEAEDKPIAVLDDIYSELDEAHTRSLTELIQELQQCFVSAANVTLPAAARYEVAGNTVTRRS